MYSRLLLSTSSLHQNYHLIHQNKNCSNMNSTLVQPSGLAPILPGENQYENLYGQTHGALSPPIFQGHQSYPLHQSASQGFNFQNGQGMDNAVPFYPQGPSYQYSEQQGEVVSTYSVTQPAIQAELNDQVEEDDQEQVMVVELERPLFPLSKPRLRWTPELHRRFIRAVQELGGYFKATPKGILKKMNVRGITRDQLKSHLQKVRNRILHTTSVDEIVSLHGVQNNTNIRAPQSTEGPRGNPASMPRFESHVGEHERLLKSYESVEYQQNHRAAPVEDPANDFKFSFEDFDSPTFLQTPNYHQNLGSALYDGHAKDMKFKDSDFY